MSAQPEATVALAAGSDSSGKLGGDPGDRAAEPGQVLGTDPLVRVALDRGEARGPRSAPRGNSRSA